LQQKIARPGIPESGIYPVFLRNVLYKCLGYRLEAHAYPIPLFALANRFVLQLSVSDPDHEQFNLASQNYYGFVDFTAQDAGYNRG
jgi:hypothetical protein